MAEMLVIATGNYDLSIAYNVGLMHIMAMGLLDRRRRALAAGRGRSPSPPAAWSAGSTALLVEYAKIDSFIATLGVGTILYGVGTWYTNGTQLVGNVPQAFADLNDAKLLGIPLPTYMVAAVAILAWICARAHADRPPALRHRLQPPRGRADRRAGAAPGHGQPSSAAG